MHRIHRSRVIAIAESVGRSESLECKVLQIESIQKKVDYSQYHQSVRHASRKNSVCLTKLKDKGI
jgi:hypothetical protein